MKMIIHPYAQQKQKDSKPRINLDVSPNYTEELKKIIPGYGSSFDPSDAFDPMRVHAYLYNYYQTGRFYVFLTKPDLNLGLWETRGTTNIETLSPTSGGVISNDETATEARIKAIEQIPLFRMVSQRYPDIIKALTQDPRLNGGEHSRFMYMITNLIRGFPASDISSDAATYTETFTGERLQLAKDSLESQQTGSFNLEFDELADSRIAYLFRTWMHYIDLVLRGIIYTKLEYVVRRRIDYAVSMYCMSIAPDGETIQYFSKHTGVHPTSLPLTAFQEEFGKNEKPTLSIGFSYNRIEAMDPIIFRDFNAVASESYDAMLDPTGEGIGIASDWYELKTIERAAIPGRNIIQMAYQGNFANTYAESEKRKKAGGSEVDFQNSSVISADSLYAPVVEEHRSTEYDKLSFGRVRVVQKPALRARQGMNRNRYCLVFENNTFNDQSNNQ
jgi:hypothetical protein